MKEFWAKAENLIEFVWGCGDADARERSVNAIQQALQKAYDKGYMAGNCDTHGLDDECGCRKLGRAEMAKECLAILNDRNIQHISKPSKIQQLIDKEASDA